MQRVLQSRNRNVLYRSIRCMSQAVEDPYGKVLEKKGKQTDQNVKPFNSIPGPANAKDFLSFLQKAKQVADRPHKEVFYELIFKEYGDIVRCDQGTNPNIYLGNADYIQKAAEFGKEPLSGSQFYKDYQKKNDIPSCLMGSDRAHYAEAVNKCVNRPEFIQKQEGPIKAISLEAVKFLQKNLDSYTKVTPGLMSMILLFSLESVFWMCFSKSSGAFVQKESLAGRFVGIQREISSSEASLHRNPLAKWIPTPSWYTYTKGLDKLYDLTLQLIKDADEEQKDSIYKFLSSYKNSDGKGFSERELTVLLADILMPATGYTAPTILWLLHDIAKNKDIQNKIIEEYNSSNGNFKKSPYLLAVIKESMRLHPIQDSVLLHTGQKEMKIGDYEIPKLVGLTCVHSNTSLSPEYFVQPLEFKPERWLDEKNKSHPYATAPFGLGARKCPAQSIGYLQIATLVQELLKAFELDSDPEEYVEAQYQPLLAPTAPFDIAFHLRNPTKQKPIQQKKE